MYIFCTYKNQTRKIREDKQTNNVVPLFLDQKIRIRKSIKMIATTGKFCNEWNLSLEGEREKKNFFL